MSMDKDWGGSTLLASRKLKAGTRYYYIDAKLDSKGNKYIVLSETKLKESEGKLERHRIFIYEEDFASSRSPTPPSQAMSPPPPRQAPRTLTTQRLRPRRFTTKTSSSSPSISSGPTKLNPTPFSHPPLMTHRQLYGLAALLWLIAGVNVLRIGLVNWPSETNILVSILWLIGSLAFFAGFIFPRVVKRNLTALGQRAEGTLRWYQCFTPSSWIIMAGMITLGITLRALDLVPHSFVTGFYTGRGLSLMLSTYPYLRLLFRPKR